MFTLRASFWGKNTTRTSAPPPPHLLFFSGKQQTNTPLLLSVPLCFHMQTTVRLLWRVLFSPFLPLPAVATSSLSAAGACSIHTATVSVHVSTRQTCPTSITTRVLVPDQAVIAKPTDVLSQHRTDKRVQARDGAGEGRNNLQNS